MTGYVTSTYNNHQFLGILQLQQLVVSGALPCNRQEAAILAGIQLHLEDAWPEEESSGEHLSSEQDGAETRESELLLGGANRGEMKAGGVRKRKELYTSNRYDYNASCSLACTCASGNIYIVLGLM